MRCARGFSIGLGKAAKVFEEGGLGHVLLRALRKLTSPLFEAGSITFFSRELDDNLPKPKAAVDLLLRLASPVDLNLLLEGRDPSLSMEILHERFRLGDLCFIAVDTDGRVAHSRWATTKRGRIPELDMDLVLGPGQAYFYNGYTRPDLRNRGIDGLVRCFIFSYMRANGFKRIYSYVRSDQPAALRAARRWQQPVARLWYLRLRGLRPMVMGKRKPELPLLTRVLMGSDEGQRLSRARAWRSWFESWLGEPLPKRSTGFHALPEEYLASAAEYISTALRLDQQSDFVLDVGCDSAMISRLVIPRCWRFVGVDFIPAMLPDISQESMTSASGRRASFVAADGRALPFQSHLFTKAYCSGVIHTLPSREDGLKIIEELVRVCRSGGEVLVASIPDAGKRVSMFLEAWREADFAGKLKLTLSLAIPRPAKKILRHVFGMTPPDQLVSLDYNLADLECMLETQGFECEILHFPDNYWCRNTRSTRSNLLIRIPDDRRLVAASARPYQLCAVPLGDARC